jgi:hypothetical protein
LDQQHGSKYLVADTPRSDQSSTKIPELTEGQREVSLPILDGSRSNQQLQKSLSDFLDGYLHKLVGTDTQGMTKDRLLWSAIATACFHVTLEPLAPFILHLVAAAV